MYTCQRTIGTGQRVFLAVAISATKCLGLRIRTSPNKKGCIGLDRSAATEDRNDVMKKPPFDERVWRGNFQIPPINNARTFLPAKGLCETVAGLRCSETSGDAVLKGEIQQVLNQYLVFRSQHLILTQHQSHPSSHPAYSTLHKQTWVESIPTRQTTATHLLLPGASLSSSSFPSLVVRFYPVLTNPPLT